MFYVGQKVVALKAATGQEWFVNPAHPYARLMATEPKVGEVYTVQSIFVSPVDGQEYLDLAEVHNPPFLFTEGLRSPPWPSARFRPVVERKTDISIFKAMLEPKRAEVEA